jgi:hypothetical protein
MAGAFKRSLMIVAAATLLPLPVVAAAQGNAAREAGPPRGQGSYADLVRLFDEFRTWKAAVPVVGELSDSPRITAVPDNSPAAVTQRRAKLSEFMRRAENMNVASWNRSQQADYLVVRSQLDQQLFELEVSRPWERDPGYYVDRMLSLTFVDLPLTGTKLEETRKNLRDVPVLVDQAKRTLRNVPADYADLALHNLANADGVGHGHPFRSPPPAGVVGWYDDLLGRVGQQPDLRADVTAARAAVLDFQNWLKQQRPRMTAQAGVGEANFNWYLKQVKLLPYSAADLLVLGDRETKRLWSMHALEKHRNRKVPQLVPAETAEEYASRIEKTMQRVRAFLKDEEIITVPSDIGELHVNVPFIVRPGGRNFWEEIQYRDPSPDILHATLPGHSFDGLMAKRVTHPIRRHVSDGVRNEGWGVYLEEGAQRLGFFEDIPRVRELIDLFGIFRAVRVAGDVNLQLNRWSVDETIKQWRDWTPWLDPNVARVDAEIYLRRPPGYGLGYTVGMIEMQKLLADRKHQLGDKFVLKDFHDAFMAQGRIPMSLIRWEMTGSDDEVRKFWRRDPLPRASGTARR